MSREVIVGAHSQLEWWVEPNPYLAGARRTQLLWRSPGRCSATLLNYAAGRGEAQEWQRLLEVDAGKK